MMHAKHYKRVAIIGTSCATVVGCALTAVATLPLWALLVLLSLYAVGLGTVFPVSVVSIQNAVARSQVGTITGPMNFFPPLMPSFPLPPFTPTLLLHPRPAIS